MKWPVCLVIDIGGDTARPLWRLYSGCNI